MSKPHKHAELIKAWADGEKIQHFHEGCWVDWNLQVGPSWHDAEQYRIKPSVEIPEGFMAYTKHTRCTSDAIGIKGYEFLMGDGSKTFFALGHGMPHRQRDIIAYRPVPKIPEGFTPWDGGACPVDGNAIVQTILRKGSLNTDKAGFFIWSHGESECDIIAYKVLKKAPVVRWQWVVKTPATDHPELTGGFYKDEAELAKHISNKAKIIGIAEWTRMEFAE